jgi:hypothetical protein
MGEAIRFPAEAAVIYEDAQAYRWLSPDERLRVLLDVIASGMALLERSPRREASLRLQAEQEAEWQRIQKGLFARHGSGN